MARRAGVTLISGEGMSWRLSCPLIGSRLWPAGHDGRTGRLRDERVELVGRRRLRCDRGLLVAAVVVARPGGQQAQVAGQRSEPLAVLRGVVGVVHLDA